MPWAKPRPHLEERLCTPSPASCCLAPRLVLHCHLPEEAEGPEWLSSGPLCSMDIKNLPPQLDRPTCQGSLRRHRKLAGYPKALSVEVFTFFQEKRRQHTGIWLLSARDMGAQKTARCVVKEGKGSGFPALFVGKAIRITFLASVG